MSIKVLATVLGISAPANAILTTFTDRASWEAAVGNNFSIETFDSVTTDQRFDTTKVVGDLTLEGDDGSGNELVIDAQPLQTTSFDINGSTQVQGRTDSAGTNDFFTIDFASPMLAFGATFDDVSDVGISEMIMSSSGVESNRVDIPDNGNGQSFFGFVADEEFTTIQFDPSSSGGDNFGMDDVVYSSVPFELSPTFIIIYFTTCHW